MNRIAHLALPLLMAASLTPATAAEPTVTQLLEQGIYQEQTVGDLDAAHKIFQQILQRHRQVKSAAAEAQLHIGLIHLKQGQHKKAAAVLQELADTYPGKAKLLRKARGQMPPVIDEAIQHIQAHYVDEFTDDVDLTEAALQGVLGNLDRYSSYLDAMKLENLYISIAGKTAGIGAVLELKEGKVKVKALISQSPASEVGLQAGDTIVSVDGEKLAQFSEDQRMQQTLRRIRGDIGSEVTLSIVSDGSKDPRDVTITRREIKLTSVTGRHRDETEGWHYRLDDSPEIGYLRISSLTKESPAEFRRAVKKLGSGPLKGLIIDLRNNGGGLMSSALEIADMFLTDGTILEVRSRSQENTTHTADAKEILAETAIVILTNRNTASAAEILAGSLQDRGRATVIGERTFGKGTVQALFPLQSGGAIRLTTARFFLPSGANLEKPLNPDKDDSWGVEPDEELPLTDEELKAFTDRRTAIETFGQAAATAEEFKDRAVEKAAAFFSTK